MKVQLTYLHIMISYIIIDDDDDGYEDNENYDDDNKWKRWYQSSGVKSYFHTSKKHKNWRSLLLSPNKLAEKVRKSGRQNFASKVRQSWKLMDFVPK